MSAGGDRGRVTVTRRRVNAVEARGGGCQPVCWELSTQGLRLKHFQKVARVVCANYRRSGGAAGMLVASLGAQCLPRQASVGDPESRWGNLADIPDLTLGIGVRGVT